MEEPLFVSPYPRNALPVVLEADPARSRRGMVLVPVGFFGVSLLLPSYSFSGPGGADRVAQIGIQSLIHPPIGIGLFVNLCLFLVWGLVLAPKRPRVGAVIVLSSIMIIVTLLMVFGLLMGDPEPGSHSNIGPGAWCWILSILSTVWFAPMSARGKGVFKRKQVAPSG